MDTQERLEKRAKRPTKSAAPALVQVVARIPADIAAKIDDSASQQKIPVSRAKFVASILIDWAENHETK
jgi:hypothetical protein